MLFACDAHLALRRDAAPLRGKCAREQRPLRLECVRLALPRPGRWDAGPSRGWFPSSAWKSAQEQRRSCRTIVTAALPLTISLTLDQSDATVVAFVVGSVRRTM